jgi:hypothetical protein
MKSNKIDLFLDTIVDIHRDMNFATFWPANPPQLQASYSDLLALKFFQKFETDFNDFNIALKQVKPNSLRSLLYQIGLLGLKVANARHSAKISQKKIIEYSLFIFDKIAEKTKTMSFAEMVIIEYLINKR